MSRLKPDAGSVGGSFWDTRAERYARNARLADGGEDPLLRRLRRLAGDSSTAIDAGAGTGRPALALARSVRHVTAVDPSAAMLAVLRRGAEEHGVTNVTTVEARWEDADVAPADVAFSSFVVTLVPEARPFLEGLLAVWLFGRTGALRSVPAAIIQWRARATVRRPQAARRASSSRRSASSLSPFSSMSRTRLGVRPSFWPIAVYVHGSWSPSSP